MGILYEDSVVITSGEKQGDPHVITVNCPDKTGLGCDLCRIILLFGLSISRGGKTYSFIFLPFVLSSFCWRLLDHNFYGYVVFLGVFTKKIGGF